MNSHGPFGRRYWRASVGALLSVLVGVGLWKLPLGEGLIRRSYDLPLIVTQGAIPDDVIIVKMDETSHSVLTQKWSQRWDSALHAQLLDQLKADGCRLVVFDVLFAEPGEPQSDRQLARAMKEHGSVVLAGERVPLGQPGLAGEQTVYPLALFQAAATNWGLAQVLRDRDSVVREHYRGTEDEPSLSWAAAVMAGADVAQSPGRRLAESRWLRYYGPEGSIFSLSYHLALTKPPGHFRDKVVFIGGKPRTRFVGEETDEFPTPFTRRDARFSSGAEILATEFLNLLRGDWLRRWPLTAEFLLLALAGGVFGFGLALVRPLAACVLAALGVVGTTALALLLFAQMHFWFPWLIIAAVQIPCACVSAVFLRPEASGTAQANEAVSASMAAAAAASEPAVGSSPTLVAPPPVAGHKLIRCIGQGSYGEVWLARDVIGSFHAVKVIYRRKFMSDSPFEREFRGMRTFTPISRSHPGFVHILHVDRDDAAGYFYYVMEAADDAVSGQTIDSADYTPKTLATEFASRGRLPVEECLQMSLTLAEALDYLHQRQLIHRDIKPSNIIFVNGAPKLADIGLVTEISRPGKDATCVGTVGYLAPEGPGTPAADVYSLGKVIYEAAMGRNLSRFPELPTTLLEEPQAMGPLLDLNEIILKACAPDLRERYESAAQLQADLLRLQTRLLVASRT